MRDLASLLRRVPVAAAAAVLLLWAAHAAAQAVPKIEIVRFGEYTVDRELGPMDPQMRQETLSPVMQTSDPHFISQTNEIEAQLCRRFGFQYRPTNLPPGAVVPIMVKVLHPTMTTPDGRSSDLDLYETRINGDVQAQGFTFDNTWEMVPGPWTFQLLFGGQVIAEQKFIVHMGPNSTTVPDHGCGATPSV